MKVFYFHFPPKFTLSRNILRAPIYYALWENFHRVWSRTPEHFVIVHIPLKLSAHSYNEILLEYEGNSSMIKVFGGEINRKLPLCQKIAWMKSASPNKIFMNLWSGLQKENGFAIWKFTIFFSFAVFNLKDFFYCFCLKTYFRNNYYVSKK